MHRCNILLLVIAFGGALNVVYGDTTLHLSPDYVVTYSSDSFGIDFVFEVKTAGWFGFGYNKIPEMLGADIVTVTAGSNGKLEVEDYHGTTGHSIEKDAHKDWALVEEDSHKNATHMHAHIRRKLNTEDKDQDKIIEDKENFIIWAFGTTATPSFHGSNHGSKKVDLLAGGHSKTSTPAPKPNGPSTTTVRPSTTPAGSSGISTKLMQSWNNFISLSALFALTLFHLSF